VDKLSVVGEVRGKGLMMGIELVEGDDRTPSPQAAAAVLEEARAHGLLVGKGGVKGNVLRLAPPLSVTAEEIDTAADILTEVLTTVDARTGVRLAGR
jgi:4-aminobutyrate aminotransferase